MNTGVLWPADQWLMYIRLFINPWQKTVFFSEIFVLSTLPLGQNSLLFFFVMVTIVLKMYLTKLKAVSEIYSEKFQQPPLEKSENHCFRINFVHFLPKQIRLVPIFHGFTFWHDLFFSLVSNIQTSQAWLNGKG